MHRFVFLTVALFAGAAAAAGGPAEAWLFAPTSLVGGRVEDWTVRLGPDYEAGQMRYFENDHTGEPMIMLCLSADSTTVCFTINLATNQHFIHSVESSDAELLAELGIRDAAVGAAKETVIVDDWDQGLNRLSIRRLAGGALAAEWSYYWD